jgi:toxin ParE1/3/4
MLEIRRTLAADADLDEIFAHIANDNRAAAERVIRRIEDAEARLAEYSEIGRTRDDLLAGARSWPVGDYLIFYQHTNAELIVVRVLHGARDLGDLLSGD